MNTLYTLRKKLYLSSETITSPSLSYRSMISYQQQAQEALKLRKKLYIRHQPPSSVFRKKLGFPSKTTSSEKSYT